MKLTSNLMGHSGKDSMREYADKMLGKGGECSPKMSKMNHGGHHHDKHHSKHRPKYGMGGDIMRSVPLINMITGPIADGLGLKKGGHAKRKHKSEGGDMETMRRGGHEHHKHHENRKKYGLGGMALGAMGAPIVAKIPKVGKYMAENLGLFGGLLPFAKGGKAKAEGGEMRHGGHHRHRRHHRADGGMMPEPELVANAKKRWADNHPNGELYAEGGETKRRGGSMKHHHRKHRADGGEAGEAPFSNERKGGHMNRIRRAIGGVGKVRLGQSSPSGHPVPTKRVRAK